MIEASSNRIPNGAAWAAILAAGIGCAAFGLAVDLAEAFKGVSNRLNLYNPVGDLSGKSAGAIVVWLVAWGVLHWRWKDRNLRAPGLVLTLAIILVLCGLIAVLPPLFGLFAAT